MKLKDPIEVINYDQDIPRFIHELLIPILIREPNSTIKTLVATELYPRLVKQCLQAANCHNKIRDRRWAELWFIRPLIDIIQPQENELIGMVLRNVLQALEGSSDTPICEDQEQLTKFLSRAFLWEPALLLWLEVLRYLLPFYYGLTDENAKILGSLFSQLKPGRLQDCTILSAMEISSSENLKYIIEPMPLKLLHPITRYWHKWSYVIEDYIINNVIPTINDPQTNTDDMESMLEMLLNFEPYYTITVPSKSHVFLNDGILRTLGHTILNVWKRISHTLIESSSLGRGNYSSNDTTFISKLHDGDSISLNNTEQERYLEALEVDNISVEFEDDDTRGNQASSLDNEVETSFQSHPQLVNCLKISLSVLLRLGFQDKTLLEPQLSRLSNEQIINLEEMNYESEEDQLCRYEFTLNNVSPLLLSDIEQLTKSDEYDLTQVLGTLRIHITSPESSLETLQACFDILQKIVIEPKFSNSENELVNSAIVRIILPHLKRNRLFVTKIKVGNLTRKMDEGTTIRTVACSILGQIGKVFLSVASEMVEAISSIKIQDSEDWIENTLYDTLVRIAHNHSDAFRALDSDWYDEKVTYPLRSGEIGRCI